MKKLFLILLVLFPHGADAFSRAAPKPTASPVVTSTPSPSKNNGISFVAVDFYSTDAQKKIIANASNKVRETLASECATSFFVNRKMIQTEGRTSQGVIDHLRSLSAVVPVKMYYRCYGKWPCTSAVAYRQPPETSVNLNSAVFKDSVTLCEWASTLAHEGLGHAVGGYDHDFKWSESRDYSVPYSIGGSVVRHGGDLFSNCCK